MTRIDFYITENPAADSGAKLACRIAEKAYQQDNNVYIHTDNQRQAEELDRLMWVFRDGSFIPHCLIDDNHHPQAKIIIGHQQPPEHVAEVMINLSQELPGFFSRFERVAEVVGGDETIKAKARERFKFYRERGYPLDTHEIKS